VGVLFPVGISYRPIISITKIPHWIFFGFSSPLEWLVFSGNPRSSHGVQHCTTEPHGFLWKPNRVPMG